MYRIPAVVEGRVERMMEERERERERGLEEGVRRTRSHGAVLVL